MDCTVPVWIQMVTVWLFNVKRLTPELYNTPNCVCIVTYCHNQRQRVIAPLSIGIDSNTPDWFLISLWPFVQLKRYSITSKVVLSIYNNTLPQTLFCNIPTIVRVILKLSFVITYYLTIPPKEEGWKAPSNNLVPFK